MNITIILNRYLFWDLKKILIKFIPKSFQFKLCLENENFFESKFQIFNKFETKFA